MTKFRLNDLSGKIALSFFLLIKDNFYFTHCDTFMVLLCRFFGKVSVIEAHAALFLKNPHDIENLEVLVTKLGEGKIPV